MHTRPKLRAATAVALLLWGSVASAAEESLAPSTSIDVQLFQPGPGKTDVAGIQGAEVGKHLELSFGLYAGFAQNELTAGSKAKGETNFFLVRSRLTFDLLASVGLFDLLEVGLALPINAMQVGDPIDDPFKSLLPEIPQRAAGAGDLRLLPKVRLLSAEGLIVGLAGALWLPTGRRDAFMGEAGVRGGASVLAEVGSKNGPRVLVNLGARGRPSQQFLSLKMGPELTYGIGVDLPAIDLFGMSAGAFASAQGAVGLASVASATSPLEALAGVHTRVGKDLAIRLGAGRGLTTGYGTEDFRFFAGAQYLLDVGTPPPPPKPTGPICKFGPEDLDGFEDGDGCAEPDNDHDGLADAVDLCPNEPETKNGSRDDDGCPDEPPESKEAMAQKLPPLEAPTDSDGDGVVDEADRCPKEKEDADGYQDFDGCPDPDQDRDGFPDESDKCPLEAETINGVADDDGCADVGEAKIVIRGDRLDVTEKLAFAGQSEKLHPKSLPVLAQVATLLKLRPELKLSVEVHVDEPASEDANQKLSQKRADSVKAALVKEGAPEDRVEAKGLGKSQPIDTGKGKDAKEKNRRVELWLSGGSR